jgi:hypothetical protein
MPATVPPDVAKLLRNGVPVPSEFSDAEKAAFAFDEWEAARGGFPTDCDEDRSSLRGGALASRPAFLLVQDRSGDIHWMRPTRIHDCLCVFEQPAATNVSTATASVSR